MKNSESVEIKDHLSAVVNNLGIALPRGRGMSRLWSEKHWVFRNLTFNLRDGETIALLGRNGSGKTTFLRTLAGIYSPDEGSITIRPGMRPQILSPGAGFVKHLTGRENLLNAGILQGYEPHVIRDAEARILEIAEIGDWIDEPVGTYSAGMKTRLGFALCVCLPSDLLLIDESLSAGDPPFREKARVLIRELVDSQRTVIIVSHGIRFLRETCNRAIILDGGQLKHMGEIDPVLDIYAQLIGQEV